MFNSIEKSRYVKKLLRSRNLLKEEVEEAQESPYVRRVGRYVQVEKHLKTCKKFLSRAVEKNLQLTENVEQETEKELYWQCIRETTEENDESCTQAREYLKQSKSRNDTLSSIVKNSTKSTASSAKLRLEASLRLQELERRAEENIRLVKTKADLELNANRKHRRKGICARLRATGPAAIIDYHHVHLNHITKLLAMTNS